MLSEKENEATPDRKYRLLIVAMDILRRSHSAQNPLKLAKCAMVYRSLDQLKQVKGYDSEKVEEFVSDFIVERLSSLLS